MNWKYYSCLLDRRETVANLFASLYWHKLNLIKWSLICLDSNLCQNENNCQNFVPNFIIPSKYGFKSVNLHFVHQKYYLCNELVYFQEIPDLYYMCLHSYNKYQLVTETMTKWFIKKVPK